VIVKSSLRVVAWEVPHETDQALLVSDLQAIQMLTQESTDQCLEEVVHVEQEAGQSHIPGPLKGRPTRHAQKLDQSECGSVGRSHSRDATVSLLHQVGCQLGIGSDILQ
jgi:hypothetical protein